jgi:carbon-monoxide dehydrogenase medium subunit
MSTFRAAFPRNERDVAASLARIVAHGGDPLLIGGGTLTVPALVRGDIVASDVVDLGRAGLDEIEFEPDAVRIGALVCYQQLLESAGIRQRLPLLHSLCGGITGGIQIRNQGTIVGALCAARPQSDIPAALVALGADVLVRSAAGTRITSASTFLRGAEQTDLAAGEFVTAVRIPLQTSVSGYVKLKGAESSWPVVTAAAIIPGQVVLGGVADVPQRINLSQSAIDGDLADVRTATARYLNRLPEQRRWSDLRADWHYRRRVAPEIAVRAVRAALQGADHG